MFAFAYDFSYNYSGKTLYYNITYTSPNQVEVTFPGTESDVDSLYANHIKPSGSLTVPSSVSHNGITYSVVCIGHRAFQGCSGLNSISLPNTLTRIDWHAFFGCSGLSSISFPTGITYIGDMAFAYCHNLTTITIPRYVNYIGEGIFSFCTGLTSISVNANNTYYDSRNSCKAIIKKTDNTMIAGCKNSTIPNTVVSIGNSAFNGCTGLTSISIPTSVTSINNSAFENCSSLSAITIPNSVTDIGNSAFYGCTGITSLNIPSSVVSIAASSFSGCSGLTSISVSASNSEYDSRNNCNAIIERITNKLILGCKNTTIPNTVSSIGPLAFSGCSAMSSIDIPNSINLIDYLAFSGCHALGTVILGTGIDSLSRTAFCECDNLNTVICRADTIPFLFGNSIYSFFGGCGHLVNELKVHCSSVDLYSSWSSYFNQISCYCVLTVKTNNDSMGSITGGGYVNYGDSVVLHATANIGFHFFSWDDQDICNPRSVQITSDSSFTAFFFINKYNVSVTSNDTNFGTVTGGGVFEHGQPAILVATPRSHFHFEKWSDENTDNPRFLNAMGDTSITAIFSIDHHSIVVNTNHQGWGIVSGTGTFDYGQTISLCATPTDEHYFSAWNDGNTDATRTITLLSDTSFTAYFGINQYTVTATSVDPSMGFVTGGGIYDYNSTATIQAIPYNGYQFLHWDDGNTNANRTIAVTQDVSYTAYFGATQDIGSPDISTLDSQLSIFPNPASDKVTLRLIGQGSGAMITACDIQGREVLNRRLEGEELSLSVVGWPRGVNFLKATLPDGTCAVQKLIIR